MGKRNVDHEANYETPTNKKRKIDHNNTSTFTTPPATELSFVLTTETVDGVVLTDLCAKKWRCGKPIGKGSFGEIFLASDDILKPVTSDNAKYVVKIEPHNSGPLFVEIHCLLKAGKATDEKPLPLGMPNYIASGGHYFGDVRYRFLILPRFDCDLSSLIKNRRVDTKNILIIADQLIDVLEHLHDSGYAHSDIKAENIMIGKCTYKQKKVQLKSSRSPKKISGIAPLAKRRGRKRMSSSNQSSDVEAENVSHELEEEENEVSEEVSEGEEENEDADDDDEDGEYDEDEEIGEEEEQDFGEDEEADEESDNGSNSCSNSVNGRGSARKAALRQNVEFGGSNPVRSCRMERKNEMYDDMVESHYLRRSVKKVNYCDMESDGEDPTIKIEDDDDWASANAKRLYTSQIKDRAGLDSKSNSRRRKDSSNAEDNIERKGESGDENIDEDLITITQNRIHLIDFGLALKFIDSTGTHRPFVMDQRRAHDGTLEFTSRDAHMGAHSRRSDLECLAYNLIYWNEGFLPWKNEKLMTQPEQVHRMKEYFMTDIKQLYKKIYGVAIPAFIHDFMAHVSNLAYHDRPNYKLCKEIFRREFIKLGFKKSDMVLDVAELKKKPARKLDTTAMENNNVGQKLIDVTKMMKLGMILPFCESPTSHNRISPKNLRSKTIKNPKKRRKKFSWTEILSTDPDQIARQRAEKEFERDQTLDQTPVSHRYSGNPTYAILEVEHNKTRSKLDNKDSDTQRNENTIKGYTKPMMDVWRKRQLMLMKQFQVNQKGKKKQTSTSSVTVSENSFSGSSEDVADADNTLTLTSIVENQTPPSRKVRKRKSGLRRVITPTKKIINYRNHTAKRRKAAISSNSINPKYPPPQTDEGYSGTDDSSNCSSHVHSSDASHSTLGVAEISRNNSKFNGSCGMSSPISDNDSRDETDFSPVKTRHARARKTTTLKSMAISDEDSRDTTDYIPVKSQAKRKLKNGRGRPRNDSKPKRAYTRKLSSPTIRAFSRG